MGRQTLFAQVLGVSSAPPLAAGKRPMTQTSRCMFGPLVLLLGLLLLVLLLVLKSRVFGN
jgi:hypothetical protein